jgi:hypothetical protein
MNGDRQSDRRYFGAPQRKRTIFDYPLYAPGGVCWLSAPLSSLRSCARPGVPNQDTHHL